MSKKEKENITVKNVRRLQNLSYSVGQLAKRTSICKNNIYVALGNGSLLGKKCGSRTIVLHDDAVLWLNALPPYKSE